MGITVAKMMVKEGENEDWDVFGSIVGFLSVGKGSGVGVGWVGLGVEFLSVGEGSGVGVGVGVGVEFLSVGGVGSMVGSEGDGYFEA